MSKTSRQVKSQAKLSDFLVTGPPQRNSSQIVVSFWFFNRPGSSATSNNSASTSDNGDKISSQRVFLRIFCRFCRAARLRSTKEKNESFVSFQFRKYLLKFPKVYQIIGQNPVKSEQSVSRLFHEPFRSFREPFVVSIPGQVLLRLRHEINSDRINYESIIIVQV